MAQGASQLPVRVGKEIISVYKDFLPGLQRSHLATSASSRRFFLSHYLWFGCIDQALLIDVTSETFIRLRL